MNSLKYKLPFCLSKGKHHYEKIGGKHSQDLGNIYHGNKISHII